MNYEKPEILVAGSALTAVQSSGVSKPIGLLADGMVKETLTAYEADE